MKKLLLPAVLLGATTLTACQSTPVAPVLQRPNNTYETTGLGKTKIIAQQNAVANAKKQCGSYNPIVLTDKVTYNGVLDENMGKVADRTIGVLGGIFGRNATIARDDDYEYTISFQCQ